MSYFGVVNGIKHDELDKINLCYILINLVETKFTLDRFAIKFRFH